MLLAARACHAASTDPCTRPAVARPPSFDARTPHTPNPAQGKALDQTLADALRPVPNPHADPGIAQLNRIRASLQLIAANSTAVGLPQV